MFAPYTPERKRKPAENHLFLQKPAHHCGDLSLSQRNIAPHHDFTE